MRKTLNRNDGYILPYVLAVFLVLSFAAVTICTLSLNNLRAQEASVEQAKATYEAQGGVEQVVVQLQELTAGSSRLYLDESDAKADAASAFWSKAKTDLGVTLEHDPSSSGENVLTVQAASADGTATVTARLKVKLTLHATPTTGDPVEYGASAVLNSLQYESYDISHTAAGGGAGA